MARLVRKGEAAAERVERSLVGGPCHVPLSSPCPFVAFGIYADDAAPADNAAPEAATF